MKIRQPQRVKYFKAIAAMSLNRVIGNGKPGTITGKLLTAFRGVTRHDGELIFKE